MLLLSPWSIKLCALKIGIFRELKKLHLLHVSFLYREAPPQGPTPYPFIYQEPITWYTMFDRKGTPSYSFCWQLYPFHMPICLELCIPLNSCKCTVFKIWTNHKTRPFTQLFSQPSNASVSPFLPTEMTAVFPMLSYTSTSEIPTPFGSNRPF